MTRFVLNGVPMVLDIDDVEGRLKDVQPESVREYAVRVCGVLYPVKQAFEVASGVPRTAYTSQTALRHLQAAGLEIVSKTRRLRTSSPASARPTAKDALGEDQDPRRWPWEGGVQNLFVDHLRGHGWTIEATADTATKSRGVDVLAYRDSRRLGAEVKGWPSNGYADPLRRAEAKPTRPSTQAGHWFSQALSKALMLLDSHPGYDSLMVLPDFPRYRDLTDRTRTGRMAADIHVVLIDRTGTATSSTWSA